MESTDALVLEVLHRASSQNPEILKPAEAKLKEWETQPGFYSVLFVSEITFSFLKIIFYLFFLYIYGVKFCLEIIVAYIVKKLGGVSKIYTKNLTFLLKILSYFAASELHKDLNICLYVNLHNIGIMLHGKSHSKYLILF